MRGDGQMNELVLNILKMVKEGKISIEEGSGLIEALFSRTKSDVNGKLLIRVRNKEGNKEKVHLVLPWKMAEFFLKKFGIGENAWKTVNKSGLHVESGEDIVDVEVIS